jgi:hypothetical protein
MVFSQLAEPSERLALRFWATQKIVPPATRRKAPAPELQ